MLAVHIRHFTDLGQLDEHASMINRIETAEGDKKQRLIERLLKIWLNYNELGRRERRTL
jgi:hypothetical protein